jgi:SAM-dependent methyltransferase
VKKVWKYISYFFYVAGNWSPWLAFFVLYHDIKGAYKYGISTFAPVELNKLTIVNGDISKSSPYEAANYYLLEKLFTAFRKSSNADSLIDLGCGKGRVLVVAAHFGFRNITGIDFATELCEEASANMKKLQQKFPYIKWKVINDNVANYNISPGDSVFFMFNPFMEEIIENFLEKLERSCQQFPRTTWFLYASPLHKKVLLNRGYKIIFQKKVLNFKAIVVKKDQVVLF